MGGIGSGAGGRVAIAGALLCLSLVGCDDRDAAPGTPSPLVSPGVTAPPGGAAPSRLLYVDRATLYSYDLESRQRTRIGDLPSADVSVSPDATRYAVVSEQDPGADPDLFSQPLLFVGETEAGSEPTELGPGRFPLWSSDGERVAAVFPIDQEPGCTSEEEASAGCDTDQVVVYEPGTTDPVAVFPTDRWSLLGWSGEHVVATALNELKIYIGGTGELRASELLPHRAWGVSPAEPVFLAVGGDRATLVPALSGNGTGPSIDLDGQGLGDGTWSPDGRAIAAVLLDHDGGDLRTSLAHLELGTRELREVPGGDRAQGNVVWSADSTSFAYVRAAEGGRRLQALVCDAADLTCSSTFSWDEGVRLLALT